MNRLGMIQDGKPVYPDFVSDTHIAEEEIPVAAGVPLYIGIDLVLLLLLCLDRKFEVGGYYSQRL